MQKQTVKDLENEVETTISGFGFRVRMMQSQIEKRTDNQLETGLRLSFIGLDDMVDLDSLYYHKLG